MMWRDTTRRREFLKATWAGAVIAPWMAACRGSAPAGGGTTGAVSLPAMLDEQLPAWMRDARLPGASLVLIRDGATAWSRAFGVADAATGRFVDADTVFEAASMSKPVFSYAALSLHDQGVLDLDTPLTAYRPGGPVPADPRADAITARHVLSHTSGLPAWRSGDRPLALAFAPGEQWQYSGEGYFYLQSVVSHLTGRTNPDICGRYEAGLEVCATNIDTWMKARLLVPFGMTSGTYVWSETLEARIASLHAVDGSPRPVKRPTAADAARYAAAGGLLCTAADYARFLTEIVAPARTDAFRLRPETLATMMRPIVRVSEHPFRSSWALGWQVLHTDVGNVIVHGGDNTGFHSFAAASPDRRSGFVVMTNGDGGVEVLQHLLAPAMLSRLLTDEVA